MIKMTIHDALCRLCKATGKYGLYLSFDNEVTEEFTPEDYKKAVPFLDFCDTIKDQEVLDSPDWQCLADGYMFILCDTWEECYKLFQSVVGDEGATASNPYDGNCRVFAMMIYDTGEMGETNT